MPAHNRALDPRMVLDFTSLQQNTPLQPDAITHDHIRPNRHIRPDPAILADPGRGVDEDVAAVDIGRVDGHEFAGAPFLQRGEVETGAAEEVLGLADVHPEAVEVEGVELAVVADGREGFLFDARGPQLDPVEHAGIEDVDARVDAVADELDGFLDEAVDPGRVVGFVHHDAVFRRFFDFGDDNGAFVAVGFVEFGELGEGVIADDVGVEDEEWRRVFAEGFGGEFEGAGGAKGFGFDGEFDLDVVLLFVL